MMAPSVVLLADGRDSSFGARARDWLRGAILRIVVNAVGHGLRSRRRSPHHEFISKTGMSTARAARSRCARRAPRAAATTSSAGGAGTCTSAAQPPLRSGGWSRPPRRPPSWRPRNRRRWLSGSVVRPAQAAGRRRARRAGRGGRRGARRLADLGRNGWRTPSEERRYLRALRRYGDAAVFVAEIDEGIVGRLSLGRDPHPASRHVADLGLMVAAPIAAAESGAPCSGRPSEWARGGRRPQARAARLPAQRGGDRSSTRAVRLPAGEATAWTLPRGPELRRRDPHGLRRPSRFRKCRSRSPRSPRASSSRRPGHRPL